MPAESGVVVPMDNGNGDPSARARIDALWQGFRRQSWFSSLGQEPVAGEVALAMRYLDGLGLRAALGAAPLAWEAELSVAADLTRSSDWSADWWAAEEDRRVRLTEKAEAAMGARPFMEVMNRLMTEASDIVIGPAAVAAARAGIADQALNRVIAGSATQACFQAAIAVAAHEDVHQDPFYAKYLLFAGGRWPLGVIGGKFHIL